MSIPLLVGAAKVDITPSPAMNNWVTNEPYDGVLDPLYTRALTISQGAEKVVIITFDLVTISESFARTVRIAIESKYGIPAQNVVLHATHTHSGPRSPAAADNIDPYDQKRHDATFSAPIFQEWSRALERKVLEAVSLALQKQQPATPAIRRIYAGDFVYNRRLIQPDGKCVTQFSQKNAFSLSGGRRFGDSDPTLTCIDFLNAEGASCAKLVHFACHSVAIYPLHKGISADWPGRLCDSLQHAEGAEALFLQGCAGDQVPNSRGFAAVENMVETLCQRIVQAKCDQFLLGGNCVRGFSKKLDQPIRPESQALRGGPTLPAEVQTIQIGELHLVTLPGEPAIGLSRAIQKGSPFIHTIVAGYSNGIGTMYTLLADDIPRGGYETEPAIGPGMPECADRLIAASLDLLKQHAPTDKGGILPCESAHRILSIPLSNSDRSSE